MFCQACGAALPPSLGPVPVTCASCGKPAADADPAVAQSPAAPPDLARIPRAPRTPSARARDLVFRYHGSQGIILLIGVIFLVAGVVPSAIFCWGLPVDLAIAVAGVPGSGTVVGTELQSNVRVNGRHPTLVHFRYLVDGATYEGTSPTLDRARSSLSPGSRVPIELLRANPPWARLAGETYSSFGYFVAFVLLFPAIGATMALAAVRSNRRGIRAFVHGTPCLARVVFEGPDTSTRVNGRNPHKIAWELTADGKVVGGSISNMSRAALAGLSADGRIAVLYDPANPEVSTVYVE
jgi:hypothetical protein